MLNLGKCPKCEKNISHVKTEQISAATGMGGNDWRALSHLCPLCHTVLGVQVDPLAIKSEILKALGNT